jgi:hypothetical protein
MHVTADERYELYLDNVYIGRGSERGDERHWFYETYDLPLAAGAHTLVARVWALGEKSAFAQHSADPGFLLCPQELEWQIRLGTGHAVWEAKVLEGYEFTNPLAAWGTGHNLRQTGGDFTWRRGEGEGWQAVEEGPAGMSFGVNDRDVPHYLMPATLPPMLELEWTKGRVLHVSEPPEGPTSPHTIRMAEHLEAEAESWHAVLFGSENLTVPAHTRRRVLVDLEDYVCGYVRAVLNRGVGSSLRVHWQEALYETLEGREKGNRDAVEGKFFTTTWKQGDGIGDEFLSVSPGQEIFSTLWWQAGRYVEILVQTAEMPLTIERLRVVETRYPYAHTATFDASDARLGAVMPIMRRALEMCSHETYMDCPYYEQLQYIGDTRLQVLITYTLTSDDRLPKKALRMFDASRELSGLTHSRYPSRVRQIIPPFSLWHVCMVHDFMRYRGEREFANSLMPGVRGVLDAYRAQLTSDGLLGPMDGWNFVDWVPTWRGGMPKDAAGGMSSLPALQFALALRKAAELEKWLEELEMAARHAATAERIVAAVNDHYFDSARNLYANDLDKTEWSEHAQCLALLADAVPNDRRASVLDALLSTELDRTTIYFSHYLFETFASFGRTDAILARMPLWFEHVGNGLKTTIESPEPTRSDCHAWGAHPIYHYFASILGIRPTAPGFTRVAIRPALADLAWAKGTMPTPHGDLTVEASTDGMRVVLPKGVEGTLTVGGVTEPVRSGEHRMRKP